MFNFDHNITLTINTNFGSIQFLDIIIYKDILFWDSGLFAYQPYIKPTADLRLVDKDSFCANCLKLAVIKGQMIRIIRRSKYLSCANKIIQLLSKSLISQKYSRRTLRQLHAHTLTRLNIRTMYDSILFGYHKCGSCYLCNQNISQNTQH